MATRKYPAPPTGHDLMSFFPPAPPEIFPEMRPGPTSGFFQRQERAYFAQAGKEIVRAHVELDRPPADHDHVQHAHPDSTSGPGKPRPRDPGPSRPWTHGAPPGAQPHLHLPPTSPPQSAMHPPVPFHPSSSSSSSSSSSRPPPPPPPRGGAAPVPVPVPPPPPTGQYGQPPPPAPTPGGHATIGLRTPPQEGSGPSTGTECDDEDESWKKPMPYAERRRAGKHTRRVVVRN